MIAGRWRTSALPVSLIVGSLVLAGCGRSDGAADGAQAARAYAAEVSAVTESTRAEIAATSKGADYRDAGAAAETTRAYAAAIRGAADELAGAAPPSAVASQHRALIALYRDTADRLDGLATRFDAATGQRALATLAQELSGEVQAYSTREAQLRAEIDGKLAGTTPSTPAP